MTKTLPATYFDFTGGQLFVKGKYLLTKLKREMFLQCSQNKDLLLNLPGKTNFVAVRGQQNHISFIQYITDN